MNGAVAHVDPVAAHEPEQLRASTWRLLAHLLTDAPSQDLLDRLAASIEPSGGERPIDRAWAALHEAASTHDARQWQREYGALFIGLGEGELSPYASWYLTGRVMDRPLANLRGALAMLGIERDPDGGEPEDHAAAVCETLALLAEDPDMSIEGQREFFRAHVQAWLPKFFRDLERAEAANAYRSVAALGSAFVALDEQYLSMLA